MPLLNTLRPAIARGFEGAKDGNLTGKNQQLGDDDENKEAQDQGKPAETIPNPPSFYYNDMEKWKAKFANHIKQRDAFKRQFTRTQELTCLTRNTNLKSAEEQAAAAKGGKGKGASVDPGEANKSSLFNQVLKRRKSRQSNYAPGVIDFDYAGDSSKF